MNRKAAIDTLLNLAEQVSNKGQYETSRTLNDLARRIALSSHLIEDSKVISSSVRKMAADLMFSEQFNKAKKLLKLAEDLDMLDEMPTENTEVQNIPDAIMTPAEQSAKTEQEILELNNRLQTENLDEFTKQSIIMRLEELTGQELSKSPNSVADMPYTPVQKEQVTDLSTRMKALGVEVLGDKLTGL
jgi:hypothetical protein